ncbi:hypothetical protein DPEC_G00282210 [Dallia pectoralis]|uniref:Uncharacterized protein n=1 Tax=Dallia pectoralis TaxID=75939 RepID=A0ACC2FN89_DALPE|nr:hypothetical protein DPEC_G00282210 [Dallia pectoralis]
MVRVKDFRYEVIPGFIADQAIIDTICAVEWDVSREKVLEVYERIKECISQEWVRILDGSLCEGGMERLPELQIGRGESRRASPLLRRAKDIYKALLARKVSAPASEDVWRRVFPRLETEK